MDRKSWWWAVAVLCVAPVLILCVALMAGPIAQDPAYHHFSDDRTTFGIPNFWNVVSNAGFLLAAAAGFAAARARGAFIEPWERRGCMLLAAGTALVAFGSGYYHWSPDSETLFWDRLPMTIVFMTLFAITIGERIDADLGRVALVPLVVLGAGSVVWWKMTGDLRFYAAVQFYPMLAIPVLAAARRARYSSGAGLATMIALYGVAKALEFFDASIGGVGGHPWKHVAGAAAMMVYFVSVAGRWGLRENDKCPGHDARGCRFANDAR